MVLVILRYELIIDLSINTMFNSAGQYECIVPHFSAKPITGEGKANGTAVGKDDDAESGNTQSVTTRGRGSNSPSNGGAGPAPREPHSKCPSLSPFHNTDSGEAFISHVFNDVWRVRPILCCGTLNTTLRTPLLTITKHLCEPFTDFGVFPRTVCQDRPLV